MLLTEDEDINENVDYKVSENQAKTEEKTNIKIDSKEVLKLLIDLLQRKRTSMDYKQLKESLVAEGYSVTEGQILNVQNKVKANKVPELKVIRDRKGHISLMAGNISDVVDSVVTRHIAEICSCVKINFNDLTDNDKQRLIAKLDENNKILTNFLKTAKQS